MAVSNLMQSVVVSQVSPHLQRTPEDLRPIVVMTCGMAGAGKSTLAKTIPLLHPSFKRISGDEIIEKHHGIYGVDYPTSLYEQYSEEQDAIFATEFDKLLDSGDDIILEKAFFARAYRDEFRDKAEKRGARVVLVFLKANDKEVLWRRICRRSEGTKTADNAFDITRETFETWWDGFEDPVDEHPIIIEVK